MLFECISLCSDLEEVFDELRLAHRVISVYSFDLPFPYHVHGFNALQRSFSRVKPLEALRSSHLLLNESMVLFDDVIEIFHSPQLTIFGQYLFILRISDSFRVSSILIHTDRERKAAMIGTHHFPEEPFRRRNIAFRAQYKLNRLPFFIYGVIEIFTCLSDFDVSLIRAI